MQTLLETPRTRLLLCLLSLTILVLCVFALVPGFDFADWDDPVNVAENPYYLPVTAESIFHFWRYAYHSLYMPVTYTLWAWCAISGQVANPLPRPDGGTNLLDPAPFHAMSILFHLANTILSFLLLRWLVRTVAGGDRDTSWHDGCALLGTTIFAVHPLQVEPVAWVTGFNNVSATFFGLWAFLLYLPSVGSSKGIFMRRYFAATFLFALALLSKPTAAAFPLVLLFIETIVLKRPWRTTLYAMAPWILLTIAEIGITLDASSNANQYLYLPLWGRPILVLDAIAFYVTKLLFPIHLIVDYGHPPRIVLTQVSSYVAAGIALAGLVLIARLPNKAYFHGAAIAILATLPMLGVVPYYFQRYSTVTDRYVYFGMIGVAYAVASALMSCPIQWRRHVSAMAIVVLIGMASTSFHQSTYWHDTSTLFSHVLEGNPNSVLAYNNLGTASNRQGKHDEANERFRQALKIRPNDPGPLYNLGSNLGRSGRYAEALPYLQAAAFYDPTNASTQNNLGLVWEHLEQSENAIAAYNRALSISPGFAAAKNNLARVTQRRSGAMR